MPPNYKRYVECMLTIVQLLRKRDKHIIFRTLKYFYNKKGTTSHHIGTQ